jgi:hypothetical protein
MTLIKDFPVFGFGAKIEGLVEGTSHCFALDSNIFNPEVTGIEGITQGKCILNFSL